MQSPIYLLATQLWSSIPEALSGGLRYTLHFSTHASGEHVPHHFVIGDERPEWIFECRGPVLLNHEMREPRERVADQQAKRNVQPHPVPNEPRQQNEPERSARKMQKTRQRFAVLLNIKVPELVIIRDHRPVLVASATIAAMITHAKCSNPAITERPTEESSTANTACQLSRLFRNPVERILSAVAANTISPARTT